MTKIRTRYFARWVLVGTLATMLGGCAGMVNRLPIAPSPDQPATLTPASGTYHDLINLPPPRGKVLASVYGFQDQTGQFKKQPNSNFSTAVTQGAASMLIRALLDSGWFIPVEREGLQNLLTERKIIRAALKQDGDKDFPSLLYSSVLLEGGIVGYETNVLTGGEGAGYFGLTASDLYRMDQVTVSLRAVDVRTGRILKTVFTTKTIFSYELSAGFFRFVSFDRLLEAEAGFTRNEPAQLCVLNAIEAAVVHLVVEGVKDNVWQLANPEDLESPIIQDYLQRQREQREQVPASKRGLAPHLSS